MGSLLGRVFPLIRHTSLLPFKYPHPQFISNCCTLLLIKYSLQYLQLCVLTTNNISQFHWHIGVFIIIEFIMVEKLSEDIQCGDLHSSRNILFVPKKCTFFAHILDTTCPPIITISSASFPPID